MLRDWQSPPDAPPTDSSPTERADLSWQRATWTADSIARLASVLTPPTLPPSRRLAAWCSTVAAFRDPGSTERRALDPALAHLCRLSREGLAAGLEAVLGGVAEAHAEEVFRRAADVDAPHTPILAILASNLPGLAVQPLLPAFALGRPCAIKSASAEPLFAAAFAAALVRREPSLADSLAALTWAGGDDAVEARLLPAMGKVLAYGGEQAMENLRRRLGAAADAKLVAYGPQTSLAVVAAAADVAATAAALARDVALFDQRGCLSVAAVYCEGDAGALAAALGRALATRARRWPPGPAALAEAAAVRLVREEAAARGLVRHQLALDAGTVIVEPRQGFRPSPGLRTVRVHPVANLDGLGRWLDPWSGRLQGVAFAGVDKTRRAALREMLAPLGVSRFAAAGELQTPDARWHNGGVDPLQALGG